MAKRERNQLLEVTLDEVSLVDSGANQFAKIVLMKRNEDISKAPKGVKLVIGFKEGGGSDVQSVIFDSENWTAEKAKEWLEAHDLKAGKVDETENTLRFRQIDPDKFVRFRVIVPGVQVGKALRQKQSFQRIQQAVEIALREKFDKQPPNDGKNDGYNMVSYLWIRDLFKDSAIFDQQGQVYRVDYTVDRNENGDLYAQVGDKVPVEVVYSDVVEKKEKIDVTVHPGSEEKEVSGDLITRLTRLQSTLARSAVG